MSPPIELRGRSPMGAFYRSPLGAFGPGVSDEGWGVTVSEQLPGGDALDTDCTRTNISWDHFYLSLTAGTAAKLPWERVADETDIFTWTGRDSGAVVVLSPPFDCDGTIGQVTFDRFWYMDNPLEYQRAVRQEFPGGIFYFIQFVQATVATPETPFIAGEFADLVTTRWPELTGTVAAHSASTPFDAALDDTLTPCAIQEVTVSPTPESQRVLFNMTTNRDEDLDPGNIRDIFAYTFVGQTSGETLIIANYAGTFFFCDLLNLSDDAQSIGGFSVGSAIIDTTYGVLRNVSIDFRTNPGLFGPAFDILGGWIPGETVNAYKVWP